MLEFYQDSSSRSEFLQRARGRGRLDGPETCPVSLLEWSPGLSQGDWTWFRTSVFLRWTNADDFTSTTVTLIIFSAPPELRERFEGLWSTDLTHVLRDPFSLLIICFDQLWRQAQGVYNNVRETFGVVETDTLATAADAGGGQRPHHDFVGLHNIAKHIIHLKESSQGSAAMLARLQEFHSELLKHPPQEGQDALQAMTLASQVLSQKVIQADVWTLRMESLEKRVQNMINLAFNVVTQHDSQMMIEDSKSMRAIATVTVLFLPLATIAAIFGCQFFNFDSDQRKLVVATDFWIFWALIGPSSIAVSLLYYYLCYIRGSQKDLFASRKALRERFCF
ncbi:MAG: hypothetical protein Q9191_001225 [Dirinaria sp. TL-2023a]